VILTGLHAPLLNGAAIPALVHGLTQIPVPRCRRTEQRLPSRRRTVTPGHTIWRERREPGLARLDIYPTRACPGLGSIRERQGVSPCKSHIMMFWIPPSSTRISGGLADAAIMALSVATSMKVNAEDRVPGLTGIDRSDDVIQARQLLMDGVESEMMVIELGLEGRAPQLDDLKARADRISTLLTAFPHLFPPRRNRA
jgi:hypothetical protein